MGSMTKTERAELAALVRRRYKVARSTVDQRSAELLADFEEQLAHQYEPTDFAVAEAIARAEEAVEEINRQIARHFEEKGLMPQFAPSMETYWFRRGENALSARRAELRRVAQSRIAERAKAAKVELECQEVDLLGKLAADALESDGAKSFLAEMPSVQQLMPHVSLAELESGNEHD